RSERTVLDPVLGPAETARAVMHRDLDHLVARRPEQGRHEPMYARVGRDRADTLPTHHAQAAGAVPHGVAREPVANGVGDARGGAPRPGIAALAPPAHRR